MANLPTNRQELIDWVFRKLGRPVINVQIADEQAEDRVDEALMFYRDFHDMGTTREYLTHEITEQDKQNQYITLPSTVVTVNRVFSMPTANSLSGLFNFKYQFYMNDFYRPGGISVSGNLANYDITMTYLSLFDHYFNQQKSLIFNRNNGKLNVFDDWADIQVGRLLVIECFLEEDGENKPNFWKDTWLSQYVYALMKEQWANNLRFVSDVPLMGGIKINADKLMQEALKEKEELQQMLLKRYQAPPRFFVG